MASIEIRGLQELAGKIRNVAQLRGIRRAVKTAAIHVKGKIAQYPPSSEANTPGPYPKRWYERGYGPRWARKSGGIGGRRTSETLGRKWTISTRNSGLTAIVGNNVSYGPFVQSRSRQTAFHARRGWQTVEDVAERESGLVERYIRQEIERILNA